jgi:hypothetical protein
VATSPTALKNAYPTTVEEVIEWTKIPTSKCWAQSTASLPSLTRNTSFYPSINFDPDIHQCRAKVRALLRVYVTVSWPNGFYKEMAP